MTNPSDETCALLRKIEAVSVSIGLRAGWIIEDTNRLVNRPNWQTKAEAELEAAEAQLKRALSNVQGARKLYARKPLLAAE
jgi:hypothetical protein